MERDLKPCVKDSASDFVLGTCKACTGIKALGPKTMEGPQEASGRLVCPAVALVQTSDSKQSKSETLKAASEAVLRTSFPDARVALRAPPKRSTAVCSPSLHPNPWPSARYSLPGCPLRFFKLKNEALCRGFQRCASTKT